MLPIYIPTGLLHTVYSDDGVQVLPSCRTASSRVYNPLLSVYITISHLGRVCLCLYVFVVQGGNAVLGSPGRWSAEYILKIEQKNDTIPSKRAQSTDFQKILNNTFFA